jgi:hypothetical protein
MRCLLCLNMAESLRRVADALNSLANSNIRGHVDESELRSLIDDYFGGSYDVDSELSEDESDDDARGASDCADPELQSEPDDADSDADEARDESLVTISEAQILTADLYSLLCTGCVNAW